MHRLRRAAAAVATSALVGGGLAATAAAGMGRDRHVVQRQAAPIAGVDSLWVWHPRPAADLASAAQSLGVRRVFLFVGSASGSGDDRIANSVRLLHAREIEVYALSGEPSWTFRHGPALAWARRALALAPFDGIHLDVEPHALPHWRRDQQRLIAEYLVLLKKVGKLAGPLEVDAQFAYGSIVTPGGTFADDILARVDGVTVMTYRDTAFGNNSLTAIAADWLQRATSAGVPVELAAETNPLPDCPYCTFHEEGQARMADVVGQVDSWARPRYPTYRGIAVEDLDGWLALGP